MNRAYEAKSGPTSTIGSAHSRISLVASIATFCACIRPLSPFAARGRSRPRGTAAAKQPAKSQARSESAVVLLQADGLREIRHPVVAGINAYRERARDVEVDAASQIAANRPGGVHA